jgi:hypothetical protein
MNRVLRLKYLLLPFAVLLMGVFGVSIFMPMSNSSWRESLGVSGGIVAAKWTPALRPISSLANCTYKLEFWVATSNSLPVEEFSLGARTYSVEQILDILHMPDGEDASLFLARRVIVAHLNKASGAETQVIEEQLAEAQSWLVSNPPGSGPGEPDRSLGLDLALAIDQFNNGLIGPGACEAPESRLAMLPSATASWTPTAFPTASSTPTYLPTNTLSLATSTEQEPEIPSERLVLAPTETPVPPAFREVPGPTPTELNFTPAAATLTSTPEPALAREACVQPVSYWLDEVINWPLDAVIVGGQVYLPEDAARLREVSLEEDTALLALEMIAAKLNAATGVDTTPIEDLLERAERWLAAFPPGLQAGDLVREESVTLTEPIRRFNQGESGAPACPPPTGTPVPSPSPTLPGLLETPPPERVVLPSPTPQPNPSLPPPSRRE